MASTAGVHQARYFVENSPAHICPWHRKADHGAEESPTLRLVVTPATGEYIISTVSFLGRYGVDVELLLRAVDYLRGILRWSQVSI